MKKSLLLLLTFFYVGTLSFAQYTLTLNDVEFSNGEISDYTNETEKNIVIPSHFNGDSVTSIGGYAFYSADITNVTIPTTVTIIGQEAFSRNLLTNIVIPDSVVTIEKNAFNDNDLASVEIGQSVATMGFGVFNSNELTSAVLPNSLTDIGSYAFGNNNLASITIPSSVVFIGEHAFWNNTLKSFTLPEAQKDGFSFSKWTYYYFGPRETNANTVVSNLEVAYTANFTEIVVSINSLTDTQTYAYPNPTTDILYVKNPNNQRMTISIFDVKGAVLSCQTSHESVIELDVHNYAKGMLLVQINNGKENKVEKILKH